jgi:hypothetical protein
MLLCLIQPSDIKQILKFFFFFQGIVVVELRVVNPDGAGADGSEDILFCFSIQLDVVQNTNKEVA